MKKILTICLSLLLLQSCATILGSNTETMQIKNNNSNVKIYLNNKIIPSNEYNGFIFKKENIAQIKFELDSHKTENKLLIPNGYTSTYYVGNLLPLLIGGLVAIIADDPYYLTYTGLVFLGSNLADPNASTNALDFPKSLLIPNLRKYQFKEQRNKKIEIETFNNQIIKTVGYDTNSFNINKKYTAIDNYLIKTKFTDTTLSLNYNKNEKLYLSGEIININTNVKKNNDEVFYLRNTFSPSYTPEYAIKWIITNYYNDTIINNIIKSTAGDFIPINYSPINKKMTNEMIEDIFETSLMDLFDDKDFKKIIQKEKFVQTNKTNITLSNDSKPKTVENVFETNLTIKKDDNEHGSGFLISKDGYFITNMSNVYKNKINKALDFQNKEYTINVIATNPETNLALCKIEGQFNYALNIPNEKIFKLGSKVFALGSPYSTELANTLTDGIISGVRSEENSKKLIQIDAKLNKGSMGGALIDKEFNLLGVVSYKLGGSTEGIGFAIDALDIKSELGIE